MKNISPILVCLIASTLLAWGIVYGTLNSKNDFDRFQYEVIVEKCNGKIDTIKFETNGDYVTIDTYKEAVPVLRIGRMKVINICGFEILSKKKLND